MSDYKHQGHSHRWNLMQLKNAFEPLTKTPTELQKYIMVEYAYMACICGEVIKSKVKVNDEIDYTDGQ